jgi:hypothetical protein
MEPLFYARPMKNEKECSQKRLEKETSHPQFYQTYERTFLPRRRCTSFIRGAGRMASIMNKRKKKKKRSSAAQISLSFKIPLK